uniref:Uncharacterized protein n=1 Tax=Myotis myotis TaxID=51298 RepID=A0A7J7VZ30_MYOMY|nr:hypothetical protein mMyoMyo1_012359 [Myotis myotis]
MRFLGSFVRSRGHVLPISSDDPHLGVILPPGDMRSVGSHSWCVCVLGGGVALLLARRAPDAAGHPTVHKPPQQRSSRAPDVKSAEAVKPQQTLRMSVLPFVGAFPHVPGSPAPDTPVSQPRVHLPGQMFQLVAVGSVGRSVGSRWKGPSPFIS